MRESSQTVLRHGRAKLSQSSLPLSLWQALPSKEQGGQVFSPQRKIKKWLFGKPAGRVRPKASFECGQHRNPKGCPRPCGVGSYVVHHGETGAAPISGLGGGLGEGPAMCAPFPWNINTSGPVQPNHTAKAGSAPNPPARPCRRSAGAGRGVRALPAARIIKAMGASSLFSSLLGVAPIFSPSPMVITGTT